MNFPFQLLSPPQGEELKSRAARVAKKSFPSSRPSYETDHRVERSEQAVKGRGRAEAEGGEKRAHVPDQSTTNGSPPWAWGNRRLLTQSAGQSTLDQELQTLEKPASEAQPQHMIIEQQEKARHHCSDSLSLFKARSPHTLSLILLDARRHTPSLSCMWVRLFLSILSRNLCAILTQLQRCSSCRFQREVKANRGFSAWRVVQRLTHQA